MKLGVNTYSLVRAIRSGEMDVLGVLDWIAGIGGEHVEIVPSGFELVGNDELTDAVREKADALGIDISNYAVGANFLQPSDEAYEEEVRRLKSHVDVANRLGVKLMRHDVGAFDRENRSSIVHFERDLPRMVEGCRRIAQYAAQFGITTTVENHGLYVNGSDRIIRLIEAVDESNFRFTLDTGNFWCMDEDPTVATKKTVDYAAMVHLKDFYHRPVRTFSPENTLANRAGWIKTVTGNLLKGAIIGEGDVDLFESIALIKRSGYDGYVSIEFEGREECKAGTQAGFENARKIWDAV